MSRNYVKSTRAPKPIQTRATYQHWTKSVLGKPPAGPHEVSQSQKKRVGPFTVRKEITNTTYELREDANPENVKTTQRDHLIEYFPKEEQLFPRITNYAVISRDATFYKQLVSSQIEQYNSGEEKHFLEVIPFVILPIQNNSDIQQRDDIEFSPRGDSRIHSPASSTQQPPRSKKSRLYEKRTLFPLPELQSHTLPMTLMLRQLPELPNPIRDSQHSNSNTPPNFTNATDKGTIAHFATKVRETYKRNDPKGSLIKLERKGYKD